MKKKNVSNITFKFKFKKKKIGYYVISGNLYSYNNIAVQFN